MIPHASLPALRTTDLRARLLRHHGERTDAVTSAWIDVRLPPWFRDRSIGRYLPDIRCPVLVLHGADDEYGTPEQVRAIAEGVSGTARAPMPRAASRLARGLPCNRSPVHVPPARRPGDDPLILRRGRGVRS